MFYYRLVRVYKGFLCFDKRCCRVWCGLLGKCLVLFGRGFVGLFGMVWKGFQSVCWV